MKRILFSIFLLALSLTLTAAPAANRDDWKRLGQKEVDHKAERDEIIVGADEGTFKRIKLEVNKSDVEFINVRVVYASGDDENLDIRQKIKAGGETRAINLDGRNRLIRKVIFAYRTDRGERKRAVVVLYGLR